MTRSRAVVVVICAVYGIWALVGFGNLSADNLAIQLIVDAAAKIALPLLGLAFLYRVVSLRPSDYWVTSPFATRRSAEVVALTGLSTILLLTYVVVANLSASHEAGPVSSLESPTKLSGPWSFAVITYLATSTSFAEETFFRALPRVLVGVKSGMPAIAGYLAVSSILFGLMHAPYGFHAVLPAAYFGLVASLILLWTNNLWYVLCGHFLSDVVVMWWRYSAYGVLAV